LQNSDQRLRLESQGNILELDPENGGSILSYRSETENGIFHWMRPAGEKGLEGDILDLSCFPLIPFSSRICDGVFQFKGKEYRLPLNFLPEKHTIHGHGWKASWWVSRRSASSARFEYVHQPDEWPWSYRAVQSFALEGAKLSIGLELQNTSDSPMPAGFGLHPYFVRTPRARVIADCDRIWINDDEVMALRLEPLSEDRNICEGLEAEAGFIDNTFTGWDRRARIEWPEWDAEILIESEAPLDFLVMYAPLDKDFFCVEPVSNVTDAFNMMDRGEAGHGTRVLNAGESLTSRVTFFPKIRK
jgi:aldose 1-epimerase